MTKYCSLREVVLLFVGLVFSFVFVQQVNAAEVTETVKIYPSYDGFINLQDSANQTVWSSARNYAGSTLVGPNDSIAHMNLRSDRNTGKYRLYRGSAVFDTSVIPDDAAVESASILLYGTAAQTDIVINSHQQELDTPTISDWYIENYGSLEFARGRLIVGDYNRLNLNSEGLSHLNSNSETRFGFMTDYDFDNIDPGTSQRAIYFAASEAPGTSTDPYLEITYTYDDGEPESEQLGRYTQGTSTFPSLEETSSWAFEDYAAGDMYTCGSTIEECGCVITSLVMAGRNAEIDTDVLGEEVQPGNMNEYLQSVDGYTAYGALKWLAASAYMGEFLSDGRLASRLSGAPLRPTEGQSVMTFIDDALSTGMNAVLAYKNGHFLWVPEKTSDGYAVRDPWYYETLSANDEDTGKFIKDYNNSFTDARVLAITENPVPFSGTDFEAHLYTETAELLFTNAAGAQVGYVDGSVLLDLERASYGGIEVISVDDGTTGAPTGKHLLVYEAGETFTLEVVGTEVGAFELEFFTIDEFGETKSFTASGVTLPGVTTTFTFDLETGEIVEESVELDDALALLDIVLADATAQQKEFFANWMTRFFAKDEERTTSQVLQQISALDTLFAAKKVEHPLVPTVLERLRVVGE